MAAIRKLRELVNRQGNNPFILRVFRLAASQAVAADTAKAAELLASCQIPKVQEFITRRMASQ